MNPADELDALMAEIINSDSGVSSESHSLEQSDEESEEETPPKRLEQDDQFHGHLQHGGKSKEFDSPDYSDDGPVENDVNVADLEALVADIESQEKRRKRPRVKDIKAVEPRKTTSRKKVIAALDGDALDKILEEIQQVSKERAERDMDKLGWGVVSTERNFDLMAPRYVLIGSNVAATLIVTTPSGERSRMDPSHFRVMINDMDVSSALVDNADGTYTIQFAATEMGQILMNIDIYGERKFEWEIQVCGLPDANQCVAKAVEPCYANNVCEILITAKDSTGQTLKVGGAKFGIGFSGSGKLDDVGLLDKMDGTYALTFKPNSSGHYAVFITLDGVDIQTTPVTFVVL